MNLLRETIEKLKSCEKSESDIVYIGDGIGASCTWDEFKILANIEYDDGWGGVEILSTLVIVFSDNTWIERREYDGSEWWDYVKLPNMETNKKLTNIMEY